jgi:type I restriction enzyme R subunit
MTQSNGAELTENYMVERPAINWLKELQYSHIHGSELSPENAERESYRDIVLKKRFVSAVKKLNPWLTDEQLEEVYKKVTDIDHPDDLMKSKMFYDMLTNGVKIVVNAGRLQN